MKFTFLIVLLISASATYSQIQKDSLKIKRFKIIEGNNIRPYIDSIRSEILLDTLKFDRKNLRHDLPGTINTFPYSQLFDIDNKYVYRLDIIKGNLVKQFVDEILDPDKIIKITIIDAPFSMELFAEYGVNGVVNMTTKNKAKINYRIAGIKQVGKNYWNNFYQRQKDELIIHH